MSDETFMQLALVEGRQGLGLTRPNPPVGAVIVREGEVIGRGWHRKAGEPHAEVDAIRTVSDDRQLRGATIYVTLEPCSTTGRTPPCVEAILNAGFSRVVIGCLDPNPAHAGAAVSILERQGIEVVSGVCEKEASELIRFFAKHITTGRPWVIAKSAITLDGRTTLSKEMGQWISSPESREDVQRIRSEIDAVLVGGETARVDNPRLTLRGEFAEGREAQPIRAVITRNPESLPETHHLLSDEHASQTKVFAAEDLGEVLDEMGREGITSVLLESGGRLFASAIEAGLIDEVVLYIAPIIGGGATRLMPVDDVVARLEEVEVQHIGCDMRVRGIVNR